MIRFRGNQWAKCLALSMMAIFLLVPLVAVVGCGNDDEGDPAEAEQPEEGGMDLQQLLLAWLVVSSLRHDNVYFWTSCAADDLPIWVYVDGEFVGEIDEAYSEEPRNRKALKVRLTTGWHSFKAESAGDTWGPEDFQVKNFGEDMIELSCF